MPLVAQHKFIRNAGRHVTAGMLRRGGIFGGPPGAGSRPTRGPISTQGEIFFAGNIDPGAPALLT